jgi:hypothetical protein
LHDWRTFPEPSQKHTIGIDKTGKRTKTKDRERENNAAKTRLGYGEEGVPSKHLIPF